MSSTQDPLNVALVSTLAAIPSAIIGVISGAYVSLRRHQRRIDRIERWIETMNEANVIARITETEIEVMESQRRIADITTGRDKCEAKRERIEQAIYTVLDEIRNRTARIEGYLQKGNLP